MPTIINSSDAERNSEGTIFPDHFPPGVPMPPASSLPAEFECQLCFRVKKFRKPSDWKKHVYEDVQPFTCTYYNCPEPKSFKRKADWVRHENERHRHLEWWICDVEDCNHKCYRMDNFMQHLVREHKLPEPKSKTKTARKKDPGSDPLWAKIENCRHETSNRPQDEPCKFCGKTFNTWKKLTVHLAKHMEHIGLPILELVEQQFVNGNTIIKPVEPPPRQNTSLRQLENQSYPGDSGYLSQVPERDNHQFSPFSAYGREHSPNTHTLAGMDYNHYIHQTGSQAVNQSHFPTPKYSPLYSYYPSPANTVQAFSPEPANFNNGPPRQSTVLMSQLLADATDLGTKSFLKVSPQNDIALQQQHDLELRNKAQHFRHVIDQETAKKPLPHFLPERTKLVEPTNSYVVFDREPMLQKLKSEEQAQDMKGIEYINKQMMPKEEKEDDRKTTFEQPKNHIVKVNDEFNATFPINSLKPSIKDGEETAPHAKNQLAELDVNMVGKASPFPPQSQDDESESACETESDANEEDFQSDESSCRAEFNDRQENLFTEILRVFWCVWNKIVFDSKLLECTKESGKTNSTCVAQSQSTSSVVAPSATSNQARVFGKRNRSEDEDDHPNDDRNRGPKKPEGNSDAWGR